MDYTNRIPDYEEGETMTETKHVLGILYSGSYREVWVVDVVKLADDNGDPIPGVGFLTIDPIPNEKNIHSPAVFEAGKGRVFATTDPFPVAVYKTKYPEEGEPTPEDIAYVNTTLDVTYLTN